MASTLSMQGDNVLIDGAPGGAGFACIQIAKFSEMMFMGQKVQKLAYRLSKTKIAIRSTTEKKFILANSRKIKIVFYWS